MILCDDKQLTLVLTNVKIVTPNSIEKLSNKAEVTIIIGSRALIKKCENLYFPKLRFIQLLSSGFEGIDIKSLQKKGCCC